MSLKLKRVLHWAGSGLALLGIVFVALRMRDYGAKLDFSRFDSTRWSVVIGLALTYGIANLMLALAWSNLLKQFGASVSRRWAIKTYGISQIAKYVPGNIFHLAGRQAMGMAAGVPGWALAKSSVWELGLISITGAVFGLLALPLLMPDFPVAISVGAFAIVIVMAAILFGRFVGLPVTYASGWYVGFLAISGLLFVGLIELVVEQPMPEGLHWLPLIGAYVLSWLAGLITPGAPAGLGVRELVLLILLKGLVQESDLLLAVLLGRVITVTGDFMLFIYCSQNVILVKAKNKMDVCSLIKKQKNTILFSIAICFILILHGALPFITNPSIGISFWVTGFAQSIANQDLLSLYANNVGYPKPAPMVFGLLQTYIVAVFIKLGLHPSDAYASMTALFLTLSLIGFLKFASTMKVKPILGILTGVLWLSLPIIWVHAGFGPLSIGMALIPGYFYAACNLINQSNSKWSEFFKTAFVYLSSTLISVFTDGYTFVMFAVGSTVLLIAKLFECKFERRYILRMILPVHVFAFFIAFAAYALYVGKISYDPVPLTVFRAYGISLAFLVIPTFGSHWIFDLLGLSVRRSTDNYFGDASVWGSTFSAPLILLAAFLLVFKKGTGRQSMVFLVIAAIGLYMALGPSLKINPTKPDTLPEKSVLWNPSYMSEDLTVLPTGNAWISENVPGFKSMRASYRWLALSLFGLIAWIMISCNEIKSEKQVYLLIAFIIFLFTPNINYRFHAQIKARQRFLEVDDLLKKEFQSTFHSQDRVFFLPYRNDFMVTYLASRLNIKTYNIGGDKNLDMALRAWPEFAQSLRLEDWNNNLLEQAIKILRTGEVDVVVIPYFDSMKSIHFWPCGTPDSSCVAEAQRRTNAMQARIKNYPIEATQGEFHLAIRLKKSSDQQEIAYQILPSVNYPLQIKAENEADLFWTLSKGWYETGADGVWSSESALLELKPPLACFHSNCSVKLKFSVFGASKERPGVVTFSVGNGQDLFQKTILANNPGPFEVRIPVNGKSLTEHIMIEVPNATSPRLLSGSNDDRLLGIGLSAIDFQKTPESLGHESDQKETAYQTLPAVNYPLQIKPENGADLIGILSNGWHEVESNGVWSSKSSVIVLRLPSACLSSSCSARFNFSVFGVSKERPVAVTFSSGKGQTFFENKTLATNPGPFEVRIPVNGKSLTERVMIEVPKATSPRLLSGSNDDRILGIALHTIDVQKTPEILGHKEAVR